MPTTLITGINGFAGQHLARAMKQAGCTVWGASLAPSLAPAIDDDVDRYFPCDLTHSQSVAKLPLNQVDNVIALAGLASIGADYSRTDYIKINTSTLDTICQQLLKVGRKSVRVIAVSSGAVYDASATPPFDETSPLVSKSSPGAYAASKLMMEEHTKSFRQQGLDCVVARPFNHIGPGQLPGFLLPDLMEQIKKAQARGESSISTGNLASQRDFTDVRDVVAAYRDLALAAKLHHDTYNICSGLPMSANQILTLLLKELGETGISAVTDQSRVRANDPPVLYGNHDRLSVDTGWQPKIPIEQTVRDFVTWHKAS